MMNCLSVGPAFTLYTTYTAPPPLCSSLPCVSAVVSGVEVTNDEHDCKTKVAAQYLASIARIL